MRAGRGSAASRVRHLAPGGARTRRARRHRRPGPAVWQFARDPGAAQSRRGGDVARAEPAGGRGARQRRSHPTVLQGVPGHARAPHRSPSGPPQPHRASRPGAHCPHPSVVPVLRPGEGLAGRRPALPHPSFRRERDRPPPLPSPCVRSAVLRCPQSAGRRALRRGMRPGQSAVSERRSVRADRPRATPIGGRPSTICSSASTSRRGRARMARPSRPTCWAASSRA